MANNGAEVLYESFLLSDGDGEWPWVFRVRNIVTVRDGVEMGEMGNWGTGELGGKKGKCYYWIYMELSIQPARYTSEISSRKDESSCIPCPKATHRPHDPAIGHPCACRCTALHLPFRRLHV